MAEARVVAKGDLEAHVPLVRIGVVPSADELRFRLTDSAGVAGVPASHLSAGDYTVRLLQGSESRSTPFWLKRVFRTRRGAERCSSALPGTQMVVVGETYLTQRRTLTTREFWVVSEEGDGLPDGWRVEKPGTVRAQLVSGGRCLAEFQQLSIEPRDARNVILQGVPTGQGFHWEHGEERSFRGRFDIVAGRGGRLCLVNVVGLEEYLLSVATSEMRSHCPRDLLRAQTIAARSWVLARLGKVHMGDPFDLCGEDHCQCYRGLERESPTGTAATRDTWGKALVAAGRICDARYAKVCGGLREGYGSVWGGRTPSYLRWEADAASGRLEGWEAGVRTESDASRWVAARPRCYCNPDLSPEEPCVREFGDYFRWRVAYDGQLLERLVNTGLNGRVGRIRDIRPLRRGRSGRIELLEIRGSSGTVRVARELEIRRTLSETHLPSSAFVCYQTRGRDGFLERIVLEGAGWGHGVGMCQVGAAAMAHHGHDCRSILAHYYPGATIAKLYPGPGESWPKGTAGGTRVPCWVEMNCYELRRCPVYLEQSPEPCWERRGSPRLGEGLFDPGEKQERCRRCPRFRARR